MANQVSDAGAGRDRQSPASTPRWVKVLAIIALVLVVLLVVLHVTGRGFGGHTPAGSYIVPGIAIAYNLPLFRL
jgi:hypothetical protein